ncbi:MAG: acyl-CoA dehydrogenase family protein, partial [Rhodocyclaceae bacterium]|nr:acyl-CoA dehydrogenase family protein [Rhodocyclaceae bacterium]
MSAIHSVQNQSTPFCGRNLFLIDTPLREVVVRNGAGWAAPELETWGARLGSADIAEWARLANQFPPQLRNFDPCGRRIDEVEFHPAWHHLMQLARAEGLHAAPWQPGAGGAQVARAAKYYLYSQAENGTQCPLTMTFASVPVLRQQAAALPALAQDWLPRVLSYSYDPASSPLDAKHAALIGMGMTEKQGGSDLRANTSFAVRTGADDWGDRYSLVGHKWFFSVPQSDAHLVLAQTRQDSADGLSCFLMPRWRRDGSRNAIFVQRLKDKLGNRSNASAEVEFEDAEAWLVGAPGQGVRTILEMGNHTRMDCAIASAGVMRAVLVHALHHARERQAFGRRLSEQPLMQNLLADLCLESESALVLALRL